MAEFGKGPVLGEDFFIGARERDGITLVQDATKRTLPARFYKAVSVEAHDGAWRILLDDRPVRTPRQTLLAAPTRALADLVAAEWNTQTAQIDPVTMPVTRLVNTALDGVANDIDAVAADIVKYAGSDLTCYRADEPATLVAAQAVAWDPILRFADETLGANLHVATGIVFVTQTDAAIEAIARAVESLRGAHPAFSIAALHVLTTLTGSALIALALAAGALSCDDAWRAAHVDEDEQMRMWGFDAEALRRRAARFTEFRAAYDVLTTTRQEGLTIG